MRRSILLLLCVGASVACREREHPPPPATTPVARPGPPATRPVAKPGGPCRETPVAGHCRFVSVRPTGAEPDGAMRYYVTYEFDEPGHEAADRSTVLRVVAAATDREALESYYRSQARVKCSGVRIAPPCAPGVVVSAQVGPPPVGRVLGARDP
jgi:hypothetical protein